MLDLMAMPPSVAVGDRQLVQILDAALVDTARRSGEWLVCRPGCFQCCIGAFAISQLDAVRLKDGLEALAGSDPARADAVVERSRAWLARNGSGFPGDAETGILGESEEEQARFEEFANDEPCPALDPAAGTCDLYSARPMTCRVFGPPVRSGEADGAEGLGVCELCYHGATAEEIAACEMPVDPGGLEPALLSQLEDMTGVRGQTIVAFALAGPR